MHTTDLTWRCAMCSKAREDRYIAVLTYSLKDFVSASVNLKYCNDNYECHKKAVEKASTGKY